MRKKSLAFSLLFIFLMFLMPTNHIHADLGDFEFEGGDLQPTEQQRGEGGPGDHEHGDLPDTGDQDLPWWEVAWNNIKDFGKTVRDGAADAWDWGVGCASDPAQCASDVGDSVTDAAGGGLGLDNRNSRRCLGLDNRNME